MSSEQHVDEIIDDLGQEEEIVTKKPLNGHDTDEPVSQEDIRELMARHKREKAQHEQQLEQERVARAKAETHAHSATAGRFEAEEATVKTKIEAADAQALSLRAKYAEAMAEGRFEDVAQINDEMAELRAKQMQDRQYQAWLGAEKERLTRSAPVAPAEQGLNLANYTPGQRAWIKAHPDFMTDVKLRQRTEAMHTLAVSDGIEIDSPEYFEVIDRALSPVRGRQTVTREPEEDEDGVRQPRQRAAPSTDMPVNRRTTPPGQPSGRRSVSLTPAQREAADFTMPDLPVQGFMKDGVWQPSRYEKYLINAQRLKERG